MSTFIVRGRKIGPASMFEGDPYARPTMVGHRGRQLESATDAVFSEAAPVRPHRVDVSKSLPFKREVDRSKNCVGEAKDGGLCKGFKCRGTEFCSGHLKGMAKDRGVTVDELVEELTNESGGTP